VPPLNVSFEKVRVDVAREQLAEAQDDKQRAARRRALAERIAELEDAKQRHADKIKARDQAKDTLDACLKNERDLFRQRQEEEAARRAQADEEYRQQMERVRSLVTNKKYVHTASSALICMAQDERNAFLKEIAEEKKYSRIGGVQNNRTLYDLQEEVRATDRVIARRQRDLATHKLRPLSCKDKTVTLVKRCVLLALANIEPDDVCVDKQHNDVVDTGLALLFVEQQTP
jgi:hypothetical protein